MSTPPAQPKLYHITHVDNLRSVVADGGLRSDAVMLARGGPEAAIGMSSIKRRRLSLPLACHPGDHVGDYVPFYFCPRSIMLYVIHRANHPELSYRGGQGPILHLEADLQQVAAWAESVGRRWAFSLSNAGAVYAQFRASLAALDEVDWDAVENRDFRSPEVSEGKQAEFLVYESLPWELVERIGVVSDAVWRQVHAIVATCAHRPKVDIMPEWYY
jgi:hypothetical protein